MREAFGGAFMIKLMLIFLAIYIAFIAVAIIGGILAIMWPRIKGTIENAWGNSGQSSCEASGGTWKCTNSECKCTNIGGNGK